VTAVAASPRATRPRSRKGLTIFLFLAPALLIYVVLVIFPMVQAIYYSLFRWNGLKPLTDFVGTSNYQKALADPVFLGAVGHNALIVVLSLAIQIPFALGLAMLLNGRFRGRGLLRLIFFTPYVLSEIITAAIFQLMLVPDGLVDRSLDGVGLGFAVQTWLGDPAVVLLILFVIISWKYFGFHMIILLAGLQGIPRELEEAAEIDGASRWQAIRSITLPLLGPTIRVSVFLSMIGALQLFDVIWATTRGGPVNASNTMATYMIDWGFRRQQLGYGSAVAVILFAVALVLALAYQRFVMRRDIDGAITATNG
jgi:raffinose/stachyose/melibiose transport system permease protein